MDGDTDKMISREQAMACLQALGLEQDPHAGEPDAPSRAEAVGYLLFRVEVGALADVDRLGQEDLRRGFAAAAAMVAADLGFGGDAATLATFAVLSRILEDRLRRTRLDLADLAPVLEAGAWSAYGAIDAVLDGVLALTARETPALVHVESEEHELTAAGEALKHALGGLREATRQLEDGRRLVERLASGA
ncbi:MAG: hypothetical protein ACRDRL_13200 [Sciscionella sp.]